MKKLLPIPLLLVAMFLTSIPISAHDFEVDGIYYKITSSTNKIVAVTFRGDIYDSYSSEYTGSVTIPSTVTYGGGSYSVTSIGYYAFRGCTGLTSITIPNSVNSIFTNAFYGCTGLASIVVEGGNTNYDSRDNCNAIIATATNKLLSGCKNTSIPNSVTSIGDYAFSGCTGLTEVTIPNSVTSIGSSAFEDCTGLTEVTIPNSVTSIGESAFMDCTGLTEVTIPNSVTSIGYDAFYGCSGLTEVTIPNSVTSIGDYAFSGCSGLTEVTIPNSVTEIGSGAFSGCSGLTEVTIPNSVISIGSGAFSGCSDLTSVTIGNSVTSIGDYAFSGCSDLTSVTIGNSVTSIGESAFMDCTGLTEVTIPNSVISIGSEAFAYCTGLTEVTIGNSVTSIGGYTFRNCTGLTKVTIGNSVTSIGYYAFYGCSGLTEVTIPNSVTSIGYDAFYGCSGLTEVTIPNSVTSIGDYAFYGCSGLTEVTIPNSVTSIGYYAFYGCTGLVDCNIETTHTSATIGLTTGSNYSPYLECNYIIYKDGDIITGLLPRSNASNWASIWGTTGRYSYEYGLTINGSRCRIEQGDFYTKRINLNIEGTVGVTYIDCIWSHIDDDATLLSEKITINNSAIESDDNTIQIKNLDPSTSYSFDYDLKYQGFSTNFKFHKTFTTGELNLTTQEAKPTSTTSVRLLAATNCDATEGTGFEWRRYDAPDEMPSSKVVCPVVDSVLVGSLRGVKDDIYYKYRPYYTSSSGKTYYGEWVAFITGDANVYFEPEVRTYDDIQVINNSATVKGYALEGTDVITAQGFEYWKTGNTITPSSTENRMTVNASGISMSATLSDLEYNSTYKYRAFVTTAKGTVYGEEVEFSTGNDPSGIENIEIDADDFAVILRENPATDIAWVKIAGATGEEVQYTLTTMSGAMIATGIVMLDGEWNAIELNCHSGIYLLTVNDGLNAKTLRLIVR